MTATSKAYSKQEISEMVDLYKDKLNVEQINSLTVAANALAEGEIQADKTQIDAAFSALQQGDFSLVLDLFEQENARFDKEAKKRAEIQRNIGALAFENDTEKALKAYRRATQLDPDNADGWNKLGNLLHRTGELNEAISTYQTTLRLGEEHKNQIEIALAYHNIGNVYATRGDLDKALEYHHKSLKIEESLGREEGMASDYSYLGHVYRMRGDLDEAVEYYNKALKISEILGDKESVAIDYYNLGDIYEVFGDLDKARICLKKSLSLYQAISSPKAKEIQIFLDKLKPNRLKVTNLGPIQSAEVEFGDLTVLVGPQGTGKSIFLQTLKLLIDREQIHDTFKSHNVGFGEDSRAFFNGYYGRGMSGIWGKDSKIEWNETDIQLPEYAKATSAETRHEKLFYIPAQRVMSLPGGVSQNFGQFNYGDPYNLRAFSDAVHDLIQNEFGAKGVLFPGTDLLNESLQKPIAKHLFAGNELVIDETDFTKRLALKIEGQEQSLGFLSWSAGQREFAPLLMGIYWLCTEEKLQRRVTGDGKKYETIEWVVIEEPEMGLHPQGITTVLLLVLELLRRGYKVVLSTHSSVVLEMVWALQELKQLKKVDESDVRKLFELPPSSELGKIALARAMKVFYFERNGNVRDISNLNPDADISESEWGGISGFASRVHEVISSAVVRSEE